MDGCTIKSFSIFHKARFVGKCFGGARAFSFPHAAPPPGNAKGSTPRGCGIFFTFFFLLTLRRLRSLADAGLTSFLAPEDPLFLLDRRSTISFFYL